VSRLHLDDPDLMHAVSRFKALHVRGPKVAVITGDANRAVPFVS